MYCPKPNEMKINAYKCVDIPRNRDYMVRIGEKATPSNFYTGDTEVKREQNKLDDIETYRRYAEAKAKEEKD